MTIRLKGTDKLLEFMRGLPAKVEANVSRGALRAGAKVLAASVRQKAPKRTGKLADSVRISTRLIKGRALAKVMAGGKTAWYAHMVEFGTREHSIFPKNRKAILIGGDKPRAKARVKGSTPKPFFRPAVDEHAGAAADAVVKYLRNRLKKKNGLESYHED